jgi:uncharacterized protein YdeI (BOF family)
MKRVLVMGLLAFLAGCGGGNGRLQSAWKVTMQSVDKPATCYADGNVPADTTSTTAETAMDWEIYQEDDSGKAALVGSVAVNGVVTSGALEGTLKDGKFSFQDVETDVHRLADTQFYKGYTETKTVTITISGTIKDDMFSGTMEEDYTDVCAGNCTTVQLDPTCNMSYPLTGYQLTVETVHST